MKGITIAIPVWGAGHTDRLLKYCIPSLLAPNNIPTLRRDWPVRVELHTNHQDAANLAASVPVAHLRGVSEVVFVEYGSDAAAMAETLHPGYHHGGTVMKECHNRALARAWEADYGICPAVADEFFADGWGTTILACLAEGKRAVMAPGYNIPEQLCTLLESHRQHGAITVDPAEASRYLVALCIPPTPAETNDTRWSMSWAAENKRGFLVRPHHIVVDFIYPKHGPVRCSRSQDNDLAHQALDSWDEVLPIQSTALHLTGGIEGLGNSAPPKPEAWRAAAAQCCNAELQAIWLKHACNDWHRHWFGMNWWCEDGTLTPEDKALTEAYAECEAAKSLELYYQLLQGKGPATMLAAEAQLHTWW